MEGLIPLFYNKMKRNKIRRTYQCLSHSATTCDYHIHERLPPPSTLYADEARHRRRNSMPDGDKAATGSKQFARFRSQRMMSGWVSFSVP
uniref:Uncharacterized protein n=1 Tax=Kalanchoe fedtschenkoi TaxID=63787 RepID=A0A7N0TFJ5_KALFE